MSDSTEIAKDIVGRNCEMEEAYMILLPTSYPAIFVIVPIFLVI